jgi:hypothetical protein
VQAGDKKCPTSTPAAVWLNITFSEKSISKRTGSP